MEFKNVPEKHVFENIDFGPVHVILVLITLASSEGSDETVHLIRAFTVHIHKEGCTCS